MLTQEIRRKFLKYFQNEGHAIIPSSAVFPHDDPTLLFTNAGMNQFKDVFLGFSNRDYNRAASCQKCIRVGGKHNDLENVGHTSRHLTFFEMLGNFSFGNYFKAEAIRFAWEVSTNIFGFEPEKIYPSVFREDEEAFELWTKYVPRGRIARLGEKDNFWEMGETGPCGPCSELYYDRGKEYGDAGSIEEDVKGERFLEFWNLVFMQFNREAGGKIHPLPKPSIDTGAGLERVISLKMGVDSVFETDVLRALMAKVENISGVPYVFDNSKSAAPFRVIADHLRCLAFAIADGAQPSNLDRGYVLRKVLRRAVRYGRQIGIEEPFLAKIVPTLLSCMGEDYPELKKSESRISEILTSEEEAFLRTLKRGGNMLNQIMEQAKKLSRISGDDAFKLKDTYGLPFEEISLLAKDAGLSVDETRYLELEKEAKERSRSAQKSTQQIASESLFESWVKEKGASKFLGYSEHTGEGVVAGLLVNGKFVDEMQRGDEGMVILNQTPFYAEMGGQVGDQGALQSKDALFQVADCKAPFKGVIAHIGKVESGKIAVGEKLFARIDEKRRQKIANNHTATHLLHWALQKVLGEHIKQAGSVVDELRLRFDFSHHKALTPAEIQAIEDLVNSKIRENRTVEWYEIPFDEAVKREEIKQFFGEKYGSVVRVVDIDYSKELCGGTHTSALGNIGLFRIAKESSIAAGIRRIEAVTGEEAEKLSRSVEEELNTLAQLLKVPAPKVKERLEKLLEEMRETAQQLKEIKKEKLQKLSEEFIKKAESIKGVSLLSFEVEASNEDVKTIADDIASKLASGILLIGSRSDGRAQLYLKISDDLVQKGFDAGKLIKELAPLIDGSGGGKPQQATAGGKSPQKIASALERMREILS